MNKVVLVPDSFKGSMSSMQVCSVMKQVITGYYPAAEIVSLPVADGGEGSVDCFLAACGGHRVNVQVAGPLFEEMEAFYGALPDGSAVVEMAACAGLPLLGQNLAVTTATTYGVGQLIAHAVKAGHRKVIVALGGSGTNDGGCGAAAALGVRFRDKEGREFVPVGNTLKDITHIDMTGLLPALADTEIITMCDIDNPLCGVNGAAHVFGPQKGADSPTVALLDANLFHLAKVVQSELDVDILDVPGAGAAGGMGGGMIAFLGSRPQMGIDTVLDTVNFSAILEGADLVFSGEGRLDSQSLRGKVVIGVARRAAKAGVPVVAVVGDIADDIEPVYGLGVKAVFSINRVAEPFQKVRHRSQGDLALTMDTIMRYTQLAKRLP